MKISDVVIKWVLYTYWEGFIMRKTHFLQITFLAIIFLGVSANFSALQAHDKVVVIPMGGDSSAKSGYFIVQPTDLAPRDESQQYDLQGGANVNIFSGSQLTCPVGESEGEFLAPVHLPDGTIIKTLSLYGTDSQAGDRLEGILKKVCQVGTASPEITEITPALNSSGVTGNFELTETDINDIVDISNCHYHLVIDLELSGCSGNSIAFYKARIFW